MQRRQKLVGLLLIVILVFSSTVSAHAERTSDIEGFVTRFYVYILDRQPDESGLTAWSENLVSGKEAGANVGYGFIQSEEFLKRNLSDEDYIRTLYRAFFDREADESGFSAWLNVLNSGMSRLHVYKGFAESNEFSEVCYRYGIERGNVILKEPMDLNEGVTKFVARCYKLCLGRTADSEGLNAWCQQLLSGNNNAKEVANGFVFSNEFKNMNLSDEEYVKVLYRVILDREADSQGLQSWVNVLNTGKSRMHVFNGFADSKEFRLLCSSYGIDAGEGEPVNAIYESYRKVVLSQEEIDGTAGVSEIMDTLSTMTGVCFLKLMDLNNDGVEELIMVYYSSGENDVYNATIWQYIDNKAVCVYKGDVCAGGDIGGRWLEFTEYDGQTYILSGFQGGVLDMKYYGYQNGKVELVRKFTSDYSTDNSVCTINDKKVNGKQWEQEYGAWSKNLVRYSLRGATSDLSFPDENMAITKDTKIKLGL